MALPQSIDTPRLRYLHGLVEEATDEGWVEWPTPTEIDFTLFGKVIVLFSYMDVNIRRIVEAAENAGILKAPWTGRVRKLNIGEAEEAVQSLPDWSEPNMTAFKQIADRRGLRNLVSHFAVRRFPKDDAYLFFTKSDRDYYRVFRSEAPPGTVITSVMEGEQVLHGVRHIRDLQLWLAQATADVERLLILSKPNV